MSSIEDLKKELRMLQQKREEDNQVKKLQKQIKAEKFAQTRGGKIFNKIADIGDKLTKPKPKTQGSIKKKKAPARVSVEEIMRRLPQ